MADHHGANSKLDVGKNPYKKKMSRGLLTAPDTRRNVRCNGLVFLFTIFLMWTIFKVFIEFATILLLFPFGFFFEGGGHEASEILAP